MQAASEKIGASTQSSGGKFIDTLIAQWMKRTGSNVALHQIEETSSPQITIAEGNSIGLEAKDKQQILQNQERIIQALQRRLKQSQEAEASLSTSLEAELRNKEEIQTKLNATWESIDTITDYFNYISESLANFQQHRVNLSTLYDNVILKQQESIQKLQLSNNKSKDLEQHVVRLENKTLIQEERLQKATAEQNKLRKQLEDSTYELQLQKNELTNTHAEEKLKLVKEQQQLSLEYENIQSRLQIVEKEKCEITKSVAQLENKLLFQEKKLQEAAIEQHKLQKQLESNESAFHLQKRDLSNTYAEEKKIFVEEQQRWLIECENLRSQLKVIEQDRSNLTEIITQKDALLLKSQEENSTYQDQIKTMTMNNNEMYTKCEALAKQHNTWERELRTKTEKILNLEVMLNALKQREAGLVNDVNRMEKQLTCETDYTKNLEQKLSNTQRNLQSVQKQKAEIQMTLEKNKATNEFTKTELQQQLKILQREKEEIVKLESTRVKNAEILYGNAQAKHIEETSALQNSYETRLLELKRTIDHLNETTNNVEKENSKLNTSLAEMSAENENLRDKCKSIMEHNNELQEKLKEATETMRIKSDLILIADQQSESKFAKDQKRSKTKRKYDDRLDSEVTETSARKCDVSTSINFMMSEDKRKNSLSQSLDLACLAQEESQQEQQDTEVTSAGKKFFKSRPTQLRTYTKRRQNL